MKYRIRHASADDAPALEALLRGIGWFRVMEDESREESIVRIGRQLAACLATNDHTLLVAEADDGALIGYTSVHWLPYLIMRGLERYISELFIAEHARGAGLGTRMLEEVIAEARSRGAARLQLVNMRERESYLRGFYVKAGWRERTEAAGFVLRIEQ